ncbi:PHP domain-containing protein [Nocardioides sp. GY 10127]|uniref:PHP domain-containing protein n=1 Tax=Nocardioides sp. GY 10127 TaxID=2569762 RepID=UPI0010A8DF50|nr:PHP domain-containing protein [Nocardioides sp. GY 10127]TIC84198.1 PHP domain-containing protein [Nocardioides sp. GY 10127]
MRIDLHTHTRASDGTQSPTELVHAARAAGLDVLGLTDHDTADGWDEAARAAAQVGLTLVRGMEISTRLDRWNVHLLAYLPDPTEPALAGHLTRILEGRSGRTPAIVERLVALGIDLTVEDVAAVSGDSAASGRPHVADALVAKGVVASRDEAFARYLNPGRPGHVDRYAAPLRQVLAEVTAAGGVSVIAHVWGRRSVQEPGPETLAELAGLGLAGLEVDHQDHPPAVRETLRGIARDLDLVVTGSSDHHGTGKIDHDLGCHTTAPEEYERLLERAARAAAASGRSTPGVLG